MMLLQWQQSKMVYWIKGKAKITIFILLNPSSSPLQRAYCIQPAVRWLRSGGPLFHYPPQATKVPTLSAALGTSPTYIPDHQYPPSVHTS
eukprot:4166657-Ditylum_brightwellii.AAC.1